MKRRKIDPQCFVGWLMGSLARFAFAAVAVAILILVPAIQAQPNPGSLTQVQQLQNTLAAVADEVRPSVVAIRADRRLGSEDDDVGGLETPDKGIRGRLNEYVFPSIGTGIIINADGLVLTNEHVVHNADLKDIECVLSSGETYAVQGLTSDPRSDLAVLRIDAKDLKPIRLGDLNTVRQGHFAIVMGNPFGAASDSQGKPAMSFGVISALGQTLTGQLDPLGRRYYGNLIQTDARINPGNSGGPLLNIMGEVIGIVTAISMRSGGSGSVGYAIPIDQRAKDIIAQLARGEEVEYGFLGVTLETPKAESRKLAGGPASGGALVKTVEANTPAAAADLKPNDIIVEFDGEPVEDVDKLVRLVEASRVGVKVNLVLYRNNKLLTVPVVPGRKSMPNSVNIEADFAWCGMVLADLALRVREEFKLPADLKGVLVMQVEPGGPADKAGIKRGQVIRRIGNVKIKGLRHLRETVSHLTDSMKIFMDDETVVDLMGP